MYGTSTTGGPVDSDDDDDQDIEASIANEIAGMKSTKSKSEKLFTSVKLDTPCGMFVSAPSPLFPLSYLPSFALDGSSISTPPSLQSMLILCASQNYDQETK